MLIFRRTALTIYVENCVDALLKTAISRIFPGCLRGLRYSVTLYRPRSRAKRIEIVRYPAQGKTYIVECGYQEPPAPTPVSLQYDPKDIDELERIGEGKRGEIARARNSSTKFRFFGRSAPI